MPTSPEPTGRVTATAAAGEAIAALRAEYGPVVFVLSHGCCDGTAPMCYKAGDFPLGRRDLLLGTVEDCPFYMQADTHRAWGSPEFILDVEPGYADGFSLPAGEDLHFVARTPSCGTAGTKDPSPAAIDE
ncbi:MAG TPA: DUF779 domain-containing protein [Actinospica sp.]|jgi:uncharacterized protein (DUF779 family)|nr:DUF779 domain-containing protein [Actinospica sp.]